MTEKKYKRLTVEIEANLYRRFKAKCVVEDTDLTKLTRSLIKEYINKKPSEDSTEG